VLTLKEEKAIKAGSYHMLVGIDNHVLGYDAEKLGEDLRKILWAKPWSMRVTPVLKVRPYMDEQIIKYFPGAQNDRTLYQQAEECINSLKGNDYFLGEAYSGVAHYFMRFDQGAGPGPSAAVILVEDEGQLAAIKNHSLYPCLLLTLTGNPKESKAFDVHTEIFIDPTKDFDIVNIAREIRAIIKHKGFVGC